MLDKFFHASVIKNTCIYNASWAFQWLLMEVAVLCRHNICIVNMIGNVSDWLSNAGGALRKVVDSAGSTVLVYMGFDARKPHCYIVNNKGADQHSFCCSLSGKYNT